MGAVASKMRQRGGISECMGARRSSASSVESSGWPGASPSVATAGAVDEEEEEASHRGALVVRGPAGLVGAGVRGVCTRHSAEPLRGEAETPS